MPLFINFILFQVGWFAIVLGGANDAPVVGSLVAILVILAHLLAVDDARSEVRLLAFALLIGIVFESVLVFAGLTVFTSGQFHPALAPYWMILMWPLFATTVNHSMQWLQRFHVSVAAIAGAVFAPVAYYAGSRMGAVSFSDPLVSLAVIAAAWAVLLPLITTFARTGERTRLVYALNIKGVE